MSRLWKVPGVSEMGKAWVWVGEGERVEGPVTIPTEGAAKSLEWRV